MDSVFLNGGVIGVTLDYGAADRYVIGTTQVRDTITYVGGRTQSVTNSTATITVSLTGLTGGLATAPIQNDFVVVTRSWANNLDASMTTSSTGWTEVTELYANDDNDTNLAVYYKVMGTTPDTSIVFNAHATTAESSAIVVQVFRGVDTTTPLDVTSTTFTVANSGLPDPASITPTTTNSIILVAGGSAHTDGTDTFTAGYLTNFLTVGANGTNDATAGMGYVSWTSGAYNPAAFTASYANAQTRYSAAAVTMALRARLIDVQQFGNLKNSGIWNLQAVYDTIYVPPSQVEFSTPGTTNWVVPTGITSISAVVIGGGGGGSGGDGGRGEPNGGGGGGGLAYGTFAVTPGETLTVIAGVGGTSPSGGAGAAGGVSSIARGATVLLAGGGGAGGPERSLTTAAGGTSTGTALQGGGAGGAGGTNVSGSGGSGGGGAGGYTAAGGAGGTSNGGNGTASTGGGGGGGGGRSGTTGVGGAGGGTEVLGAGANGTAGTSSAGGGGGSGGTAGATNSSTPLGGGLFGGGGGGRTDSSGTGGAGGSGAVRIIWGSGRAYPSTGTGDM